jgi:multiple sugar transport system permease protein
MHSSAKLGHPGGRPQKQFEYEGQSYDMYRVPMEDGDQRYGAGCQRTPGKPILDPDDPEAGLITWQGSWRTLDRDWQFDPQWDNFHQSLEHDQFPQVVVEHSQYAGITTFGAVFSSALVAYGFARFRIPKKNVLFMLMLSTVICPGQ